MSSTTISVSGNQAFKKAMKKLSHKHETSMAVLVRRAIDAMYGDEIESIMSSFFTEDDAILHHLNGECKEATNG